MQDGAGCNDLPRPGDGRAQDMLGKRAFIGSCNPHPVIACDLAAMDATEFAKLDIAGWRLRPWADDRRPSRRLAKPGPGHGFAVSEVVEFGQRVDRADGKFLWPASDAETGDCARGGGVREGHGFR